MIRWRPELRTVFTLLARLPLPVAQALGAGVGALAWRLDRKRRRLALLHLERCLPELDPAERQRVARASLHHFGRAVFEGPGIWFAAERRVRRWIRSVEGAAAVDEALAAGRGAVVFTPHLGSWEAVGVDASLRWPLTTLYKAQGGELDAVALEGRSRFGARLAGSDAAGVRKLLGALRRGEAVGFLPDQDPPWGSGEMAPFFGRPAHTPVLPVRLIQRTGAASFFSWAQRLPRGRGFHLRYLPGPPELASEDTTEALTAMNAAVEDLVRQCPEQYWWGYPRFRRQPPEAGSFYPPGLP